MNIGDGSSFKVKGRNVCLRPYTQWGPEAKPMVVPVRGFAHRS